MCPEAWSAIGDNELRRLQAAFDEGGVHIVAAPIDYTENTRVLIEELQTAALGDAR